ncbi:MAG: 3-deoxy-7-phosphoheptulonate synthase [Verrucomicrobiae bacterium]|nr:3-deoxy-7-phosphoheptulonate synthase [Verrucomicrobiae bacterium]
MIVVLKTGASKAQINAVIREVQKLGYRPHPIRGVERTVVAAIGDERVHHTLETLASMSGVDQVMPVQRRYKLASREAHPAGSVVRVRGVPFGGRDFPVIAGPCSVESEKQVMETARVVKAAGARLLRGGAFKPRTSPYEFQGLKQEGLEILAAARAATGLGIVTEVLSERDVDLVARHADMLQIGARNAQNFALLVAAAESGKPILLKRGLSMRVEEWLFSAEYVLSRGNPNVILCERGVRTFETLTRNTLDLGAVALAKTETHLPVIVDPSQGAGRADLVNAMSRGAVAVGADGLIIEVHPDPRVAMSDGAQQVTPVQFGHLMRGLAPFLKAAGRRLA